MADEVAKILWDNILAHSVATITASSESSGFEKENVYDYNTSDHWKATSAGTNNIIIDYGSSVAVDAFSMFSHTLVDNSGSFQLYYSDTGVSGPWVAVFSAVTPIDSKPVLKTFTSISKRYFKFEVVDSGSPSTVGVVMLGTALALPYNMMPGFTPPDLAWNDTVTNSISETGQFLGRNVRRKGVKFVIKMPALLTKSFVSGVWRNFMAHARTKPFVFAWDTVNETADVAYCWTVQAIAVSYNTQAYLGSSVNCEGLIE